MNDILVQQQGNGVQANQINFHISRRQIGVCSIRASSLTGKVLE